MRFTSPSEVDTQETLFKDYILASDEYMGAYIVKEMLNSINWYGCDFGSLTDLCYYRKGVVHSTWCLCITMLPKDAKKLSFIINRLSKQKGWKWHVDLMESDDMWRYGF